MVVDPFTATVGLVVGGYLLVRGVLGLFKRKVVVTSAPRTVVATTEIPAQPLIVSKDIAFRRALTAVKRAVTFAKKVTTFVQNATVALSRGLTSGTESVWQYIRFVCVFSKTFLGDIVHALFSPAVARAMLARRHTRLLVVSAQVFGLLKPFLKGRPRNRDTITPVIAA